MRSLVGGVRLGFLTHDHRVRLTFLVPAENHVLRASGNPTSQSERSGECARGNPTSQSKRSGECEYPLGSRFKQEGMLLVNLTNLHPYPMVVREKPLPYTSNETPHLTPTLTLTLDLTTLAVMLTLTPT
jgi:hypothetical protein